MINKILILSAHSRSLVNFRGPLVKALSDKGLEVHAAAPELSSAHDVAGTLSSWGVKLHDIDLGRTGVSVTQDIGTVWGLYRLLKSVAPGAVFTYNIKPVIYGTLAGALAGVPGRFALITGLGYAFTGDAGGRRYLVQKVARFLYRQALRRASRVFFQNPDDEALFRDLGLLPHSTPSTVVNGSGVDTEHYALAPPPSGDVRFLMLARLLGDKGVREYAEAAAIIRERYPEVTFRLAGDLDSNPDAVSQEELDAWVRGGHLEYMDRIPDVRPELAAASVYVLPSYREGTPRTVLEAMSMGRAVITTDAPGCRETVVDGYNGYLVPVKDVGALIESMERFILEPDLAVKMGQNARKVAEDKYDVHKVNAAMLHEMGIM